MEQEIVNVGKILHTRLCAQRDARCSSEQDHTKILTEAQVILGSRIEVRGRIEQAGPL